MNTVLHRVDSPETKRKMINVYRLKVVFFMSYIFMGSGLLWRVMRCARGSRLSTDARRRGDRCRVASREAARLRRTCAGNCFVFIFICRYRRSAPAPLVMWHYRHGIGPRPSLIPVDARETGNAGICKFTTIQNKWMITPKRNHVDYKWYYNYHISIALTLYFIVF